MIEILVAVVLVVGLFGCVVFIAYAQGRIAGVLEVVCGMLKHAEEAPPSTNTPRGPMVQGLRPVSKPGGSDV